MKETGIIMSGHHPVDILEGRKTITRRTHGLSIINDPPQRDSGWQLVAVFQDGCARFTTPSGGDITLRCPYGGYGDRLWGKETLYRNPYFDEAGYVADNSAVMVNQTIGDMLKWRWKRDILPAMFMPKEASRILLEITDVRAERLQEISREDCRREGSYMATDQDDEGGFVNLWDSLNGKKYPWASNPWVWVISFKVIKGLTKT